MASEVVNAVVEAERKAAENEAKAELEAKDIVAKANVDADKIIADARAENAEHAAADIERLNLEAEKTVSAARQKAKEQKEETEKMTQSKLSAAAEAVVSAILPQ